MWQRYYLRWRLATREYLNPELLELMTPPDKTRYSAFAEPKLLSHLQEREADALIIAGSETDVCVIATVLGAVDLDYRVVVVRCAALPTKDMTCSCTSTARAFRNRSRQQKLTRLCRAEIEVRQEAFATAMNPPRGEIRSRACEQVGRSRAWPAK